jgi:uncharacterized protein
MRNKLLPIIAVLILLTQAAVFGDVVLPDPTNNFFVNDYAGVLDEDVKNNIMVVNQNYQKTSEKPQIVVAVVKNMQGLDENAYAVKLFEKWGIGNKEYDNGVLVLLSMEERRIKIEVGYGLEGAITDAEAGRILDDSLEYLSGGDYSKGINNIFFLLARRVNEEYGYDENVIFSSANVPAQRAAASGIGNLVDKLIPIIILLILFGWIGRGPGGRRRGIYFIPPIGFGGGGFGGFGGGGFGGGGFGGGGGRSGGGGAGRGF